VGTRVGVKVEVGNGRGVTVETTGAEGDDIGVGEDCPGRLQAWVTIPSTNKVISSFFIGKDYTRESERCQGMDIR
jgi:hypothetical protein